MLALVLLVVLGPIAGLTADIKNENTIRSEMDGPGARMMTNIALVGSDPSSASINRDQSSVVIDPSTLLEKASKDYLLNDIIEDEEDRFITTRSGKLRANLGTGQEADMWADDQTINSQKILSRKKRCGRRDDDDDDDGNASRVRRGRVGRRRSRSRSRSRRVNSTRRERRRVRRQRKRARKAARKAARRAASQTTTTTVVTRRILPADQVVNADGSVVTLQPGQVAQSPGSQTIVTQPGANQDIVSQQPTSMGLLNIQTGAITTSAAGINKGQQPTNTAPEGTQSVTSQQSKATGLLNIQTAGITSSAAGFNY